MACPLKSSPTQVFIPTSTHCRRVGHGRWVAIPSIQVLIPTTHSDFVSLWQACRNTLYPGFNSDRTLFLACYNTRFQTRFPASPPGVKRFRSWEAEKIRSWEKARISQSFLHHSSLIIHHFLYFAYYRRKTLSRRLSQEANWSLNRLLSVGNRKSPDRSKRQVFVSIAYYRRKTQKVLYAVTENCARCLKVWK